MSRTFKSKDAQRLHRSYQTYNRYYGYSWDYIYRPTQEEYDASHACFWGSPIVPYTTKRDIYENERYVWNETPLRYITGMCIDSKDRRLLNRQHRMDVKRKIKRFMNGVDEDVITTAAGPRNPSWHWF